MATQKETVEFILGKLRDRERFTARAMFGEFALYADGQVVALICDDLLHVKILPASQALAAECEKGHPYPGAKLYYVVDEGQLSTLTELPAILGAMAASIPPKKAKRKTPVLVGRPPIYNDPHDNSNRSSRAHSGALLQPRRTHQDDG